MYFPTIKPIAVEVGAMMSEWQPIASAPKDGRAILLWWPYWSHTPIAAKFLHGHWYSENVLSQEGDGPTHWMKLPDPPKGGEGDASSSGV